MNVTLGGIISIRKENGCSLFLDTFHLIFPESNLNDALLALLQ